LESFTCDLWTTRIKKAALRQRREHPGNVIGVPVHFLNGGAPDRKASSRPGIQGGSDVFTVADGS
jgi:hypothetical protein